MDEMKGVVVTCNAGCHVPKMGPEGLKESKSFMPCDGCHGPMHVMK